jgi:hypothetical protein
MLKVMMNRVARALIGWNHMKRISRKRIFYVAVASLAANALLTDVAMSAQNFTAPIALVQPPSNFQDCVFFTLVGIPQADDLSQSHNGK